MGPDVSTSVAALLALVGVVLILWAGKGLGLFTDPGSST